MATEGKVYLIKHVLRHPDYEVDPTSFIQTENSQEFGSSSSSDGDTEMLEISCDSKNPTFAELITALRHTKAYPKAADPPMNWFRLRLYDDIYADELHEMDQSFSQYVEDYSEMQPFSLEIREKPDISRTRYESGPIAQGPDKRTYVGVAYLCQTCQRHIYVRWPAGIEIDMTSTKNCSAASDGLSRNCVGQMRPIACELKRCGWGWKGQRRNDNTYDKGPLSKATYYAASDSLVAFTTPITNALAIANVWQILKLKTKKLNAHSHQPYEQFEGVCQVCNQADPAFIQNLENDMKECQFKYHFDCILQFPDNTNASRLC